jgi:hypothetical protein
VRFNCQLVPHNIYIDVDEYAGYCAMMQYDLIVFSPGLIGPPRLLEACRFALMLNGEIPHGGFMLLGDVAAQLCFRVALPTHDTLLTRGQMQTALGLLCCEIDLCYPLIQQVLWGTLTAEGALAEYRRRRDGGAGDDGDNDGGNDGDDRAPEDSNGHTQRPEAEPPSDEAQMCTNAEIDRIDAQFLANYDRNDPFSAALAEALWQQRARREDAS